MPEYIYIALFVSILLAVAYVIFYNIPKNYASLFIRISTSIAICLLAVLSIIATGGGLGSAFDVFRILIVASLFFALLESTFIVFIQSKIIKLDSHKANLICVAISGLSLLSGLAAIIAYYGFNIYVLIFALIYMMIFYYLDVYLVKGREKKDKIIFTIYGFIASLTFGTATSMMIFNSFNNGVFDTMAFCLMLGYGFYYVSDMIHGKKIFVKASEQSPEENTKKPDLIYLANASYYAGLILIAVSICFIFF